MFICINNDGIPPTLRYADRTQFVGKLTRRLRRRPAFLRAQSKGVLIRATDPIITRNIICGFGHAVCAIGRVHFRVYKTPPDGCVINCIAAGKCGFGLGHNERGAGHAFNAPCDHQFVIPRFDPTRGKTNGVHTTGAQTVYRDPWHILRQSRQKGRHTGNVAVVFARLVRIAVNNLIRLRPIHLRMTRHQFRNWQGRQIICTHG